jgi:predicted nucleic acid-binding protein
LDKSKKILVKDACIIIDLIELDLLDVFLSLDYIVITSQSVVKEITDEGQAFLLEDLIKNRKIQKENDGPLMDILNLMKKYPGISYADTTVLELSLRIDATLLSADKLLRKAGNKEGTTICGTLWVITELYNSKLITNETAIEKVKFLMKINSRIPITLCKTMITQFEQDQITYYSNK